MTVVVLAMARTAVVVASSSSNVYNAWLFASDPLCTHNNKTLFSSSSSSSSPAEGRRRRRRKVHHQHTQYINVTEQNKSRRKPLRCDAMWCEVGGPPPTLPPVQYRTDKRIWASAVLRLLLPLPLKEERTYSNLQFLLFVFLSMMIWESPLHLKYSTIYTHTRPTTSTSWWRLASASSAKTSSTSFWVMELVTTQQGTAASALSFHWQRRHRCRHPDSAEWREREKDDLP